MRLFAYSLLLWLVSAEPDNIPDIPEQAGCVPRRFDSSRGPDGAPNMTQCQGDCDDDTDCAPGLKCKQRDVGEAVPGCSGGLSYPQMDYCYDPACDEDDGLPPLDSSFGPNGGQSMPVCSGDCDEDADCAQGLQCFQRDRWEAVPGCSGRGVRGFDYCYSPTDPEPTTTSMDAINSTSNNSRTSSKSLSLCL